MNLLKQGSHQWIRKTLAVCVSFGFILMLLIEMTNPAQQAVAAQDDETAKSAYGAENQLFDDNDDVDPGSQLTYAIAEEAAVDNEQNESKARTLTDTMSANQSYVPGSLEKHSGGYPGLTINEPGTTDWSEGEDIAKFDPVHIKTSDLTADYKTSGQPVWGNNSQYVEAVSSPEAPSAPNRAGDGMNPTIAYNKHGEEIVWSVNHHDYNPTLPCEMTGSRQDCSAHGVFGSSAYLSAQNNTTHTYNKTTGLTSISKNNRRGVDHWVGVFDFSDVKPGVAPRLKKEVQILSGVHGVWTILLWSQTGLFESNGKYYQIGISSSSRDSKLVLGCYDPVTEDVCQGFTSSGNVIDSSEARGDGSVVLGLEPRVRGEVALADGKYAFTITRGGRGEAYCVKPQGNTLVNCDGSTDVKPVSSDDTNTVVVLPVVEKDNRGSTIVPEQTNEGQERHRVTGFCRGGIGYNKDVTECYDLNGNSIGMPFPGYQTYGELHTRVNDGFAYPANSAQVIYPLYYGTNRGSCYDFEKKSKCELSPGLSNADIRSGATWLDGQTINGRNYRGEVYGARMLPGTDNCMVTRGDGGGQGMYLYWRVDENGRITPAGTTCPELDVQIMDQSGRYCAPGEAGMTQWGELSLRTVNLETGREQTLQSAPTLEYRAYDPETGLIGDRFGTVRLQGNGPNWTVPRPDFLDYATTKNFSITVTLGEEGVAYQFTQHHEADGQPSVCYDAQVADQCSTETESLTNTAKWTGATEGKTTLKTTYDKVCLDLTKTITGDPVDNENNTHTVSYDINVTTTDEADVKQKYTLVDETDFAKGYEIESWTVEARGDTPAVDPVIKDADYIPGETDTIAKDREIEPGETHTYRVSFVVSGHSMVAEEVRECEIDTGGRGLFNEAILNPGKNQIVDDDCGDIPAVPKARLTLEKDFAEPTFDPDADTDQWPLSAQQQLKETEGTDAEALAVTVTGLTGEDEVTSVEVPAGEYQLSETLDEANEWKSAGYELESLVCEATDPDTGKTTELDLSDDIVALADGQDVTCTFTNATTPGKVVWKKVSKGFNSEPLTGSEWDLTGPDADTSQKIDDPEISEYSVGDLMWGDYTLTETQAPAGYELLEEPFEFSVGPQKGSEAVFTVDLGEIENKQRNPLIIPFTGGTGSWVYWVTGGIIAGLAALFVLWKYRKGASISN